MPKQDEKAFFDQEYSDDTQRIQSIGRYYAITKSSATHYRDLLLQGCEGLRVLEYGCGDGSFAFDLAQRGADVVGIDISSVAIENAAARAAKLNLRIEFREMDAEALQFPADDFDLVCGSAIIHHLDIGKSMSEVARVLRPRGRAIFSEPLGHNPALWAFRRLTPHLHTPDEHPLVKKDLDLMRRTFRRADIRYFHLASFFAIPFLPTRIFWPVLKAMDGLDAAAFRVVPPLGLLAWYCVITLGEPLRAPAAAR